MYKNNLIGIELQRTLGWVDIDGDSIAEIADSSPYGGFIDRSIDEWDDTTTNPLVGPYAFTVLQDVNINECSFKKIRIETGEEGLVPVNCAEFNEDVVNIYNGIGYVWEKIAKPYGTVLLARLTNT